MGKFQPNDVGIQRTLKHIISSEAAIWFMKQAEIQLKANPNKPVQLPTEIGRLHDGSVSWVCKAYKFFNENPEVVKQVRARNSIDSFSANRLAGLVLVVVPRKWLEFVV